MAKSRSRNPERERNDVRSLIAQGAARLMAEDGIDDYATAKRKAARQAGLEDSRNLPTNEEIDAALHLHQALYGGEAHVKYLRSLREQALAVMRDLERFNPYLTGPVLKGTAGRYADIDLQLYTDNEKGVELYLMARGTRYRPGQRRLWIAEEARTVSVFTIEDGGAEIALVVLGLADLRVPVRTTAEGKPVERAHLPAVEALLDEPS
jgi:hypothetical protein